jgi:hypothetical protein
MGFKVVQVVLLVTGVFNLVIKLNLMEVKVQHHQQLN